VLLALGPHAAAAPLGATLEPVLSRPVSWTETSSAGADPASATGELAESARSVQELGAPRRAVIAPDDLAGLEVPLRWTDGAPLVARRAMGRGFVWVVTLPVSVDASDLALRPAFLSLLDAWGRDARGHAVARRSDVGSTWAFAGAHSVEALGPSGSISTAPADGQWRVVPPLIGQYRISVDGQVETRVAAPVPRELDLRPRAAASKAIGASVGERRASVDLSGHIAFALLTLVALEMALRLWSSQKEV
jgi:hypothetical protein